MTTDGQGVLPVPRRLAADDVLDNLRSRLVALEVRFAQLGDAQSVDGSSGGAIDVGRQHEAAATSAHPTAATPPGSPPHGGERRGAPTAASAPQSLPMLQLEQRLAHVRALLQANAPMCASVSDLVPRLQFITGQRKQWIQRHGAVGGLSTTTADAKTPNGDGQTSGESSLLYRCTRDEYLCDVALLKTFALSRPCATQQAAWRAVIQNVERAYGCSSSDSGGSGGGASLLTSALVPGGALQHNLTFQVEGETKTLDDLAALLHENRNELQALEARWHDVCATFEHAVTWANRMFCEMDMALEVEEAFC